ncbi:Asp-tRNA(Asn)/Glu-tRNA(Gln) amidotransferase subunit GatA [Patescibacteria group bacterium]|nr:MAG: Asp-tRNA(Asn)/Glu-tRNA(Gln) amidotransferase subunit GatA [Patescibacteria group bacterium]
MYTIRGAHQAMKAGDFTPLELAEDVLRRAQEANGHLNIFLEIFPDVLDQARVAVEKFRRGEATTLSGIPIAVKDNILIEGRRASAGSRILDGFISPYDATVIGKLKREGAVFVGRANMDEFAMGSSTEHSAFGPVRNPLDPDRVPGGSSGGSAAAVAARAALGALGSDTGGSVRQPASFCGCVGLKPTYGAVSRYGLIALASSLDQIGPLGKTVDDVEILFESMRGVDSLDSTSFSPTAKKVSEPKVLGIPSEVRTMKGVHPDVLHSFDAAAKRLSSLGYSIREIEMPSLPYSLAVYYIIMPAEASSNLARYDGVKYGFKKEGKILLDDYLETRGRGFGQEARRRIMLGTYVLSAGYYEAFYGRAQSVQRVIAAEFERAFGEVDALLSPTAPTPPFALGEKTADPLAMYAADMFTVPANIAGVPALSVPSGVSLSPESGAKLPLGLQIMAPHHREDILFSIGKKFLGEQL